VEEPSAGEVAEDVQRKTSDALAAVDKAEQLESTAAAKELAERLEREHNLPADVLQGLEGLKKSDPSPGQAASEAREAASAAREEAARKIEEAAAAAERAGQLAENAASADATRADDASAKAVAQQTSSPQGEGEQGERKQGDGEQAEGKQGVGEQAQSGQESQGEPHGRSGVGEKSAEAAEAMRKEAQRQANALGIPDGQGEGQSQSGESNPSEQQGESNPGEPNSGEQNSGEPNSGEGKSGEGKGKTESQGGGGLSAEIARLIREQSSKADPAALSRILESQGWFRIKGAAKDGLGDGNLKDVPEEYRDLVRAYFLKLSEEK
jgi:colicin import membrane protein